MKRVTFILMAALLAAASATAGDGGTVSPFAWGAGARDLGLGGAGLAICDDATAAFWNPSRLAGAERFSASGFYTQLYETDVVYQYVGIAWPTLDFGSFGLGVFRLGVNGIEQRDASNYRLGEIQENRIAAYLAYGRRISGYDFGLAATIEHHSIGEYTATSSPGINLSLSRSFETHGDLVNDVTVSLVGRNALAQTVDLAGESSEYAVGIDMAASLGLLPDGQGIPRATLSTAYSKADYIEGRFSVGLEYDLAGLLQLRSGLRGSRFAGGVGLSYHGFRFDYAYVDRDLDGLHTFSLTTSLGASVDERRELRARRRETEFNSAMTERLTERNRRAVEEIAAQSKVAEESGDLRRAAQLLDRALFMARGSGLDTVTISRKLAEYTETLAASERRARFNQLSDSAGTLFDRQDYLGARYYAEQALQQMPGDPEATQLRHKIDRAIAESSQREKLIEQRLWAIDSLLGYARYAEAKSALNSLLSLAPENRQVQAAHRRVLSAFWQERAREAYEQKDYPSTLAALDSIFSFLPDLEWAKEMKRRVTYEQSHATAAQPTTTAGPELSPELARQAGEIYHRAQEAFRDGDLQTAVEGWEQVERIAPGYQSVREYLVNAYRFLGVEYYGKGDLAAAVAVWMKAARLAPNNDEIRAYIQRAESELHKLRELSYEE